MTNYIFDFLLFTILPSIFFITNFWRGRGEDRPFFLPTKTTVYLFETLIIALILYIFKGMDGMPLSLIYFITRWACTAPGWGKYFPHCGQNYREKEFFPVDWIMSKVMPWNKVEPCNFVIKWKTIAMTLRFILTFGLIQVPLFALIVKNWFILFAGIIIYSLMGLIYFIAFSIDKEEPVGTAEKISGFFMGIFLAITIFLFI